MLDICKLQKTINYCREWGIGWEIEDDSSKNVIRFTFKAKNNGTKTVTFGRLWESSPEKIDAALIRDLEYMFPEIILKANKNNTLSEKEKTNMALFNINSIKKVIYNGNVTIVFWSDGSKAVVKCGEGDTFDPEKGLMTAIVKRLTGKFDPKTKEYTWGKSYEAIQKWLPEGQEKQKQLESEKKQKAADAKAKEDAKKAKEKAKRAAKKRQEQIELGKNIQIGMDAVKPSYSC